MTEETQQAAPRKAGKRKLAWRWLVMPFLLILTLAIAAAWFQRQQLARDAIEDYLTEKGVDAQYDITSIGPRRQEIENLVIGDPGRPDLTVRRIVVSIVPRLGVPSLRKVEVEGARAFGTYRDGQLSFGQLDTILFGGDEVSSGLPDIDVAIRDSRTLLQTDFGDVGISLTGEGKLSGGFEGKVAALGRGLSAGNCSYGRVSAFGKLALEAQRPLFTGPLRLRDAACGDTDLALGSADIQLDAMVDADLAGVDTRYTLEAGSLSFADAALAALSGNGRASWRDGQLNVRYDMAASDVSLPEARFAALAFDGTLRANDQFERLRAEADVTGEGLQVGDDWDAILADAAAGTDGTLLGGVLRKVRGALLRQLPGSRLQARGSFRKTGDVISLVVPQASIGGRTGRLLQVSDLQYAGGRTGAVTLSGRFLTGGRDMPRVNGRIARAPDGGFSARLAMAEYVTDDGRLALPVLRLRSVPGGVAFSGQARASGRIPGGIAEGLEFPLSGSWRGGELALWDSCTDIRFRALSLSNLTVDSRSVTLCPARGKPILEYGRNGLRLAAGAPSLALTGRLGGTPISVDSGAIGFAYPGALAARDLEVALGPADTAARFTLAGLTAELGTDLRGTFEGTDVFLDAVPLDIFDASGNWRYSGGRLALSNGTFRVEDRQESDRFEPLFAQGATLDLFDGVISADAPLGHPRSTDPIALARLSHDLSTGIGHADIAVPGIQFGSGFQPTDLTRLALGVVALVDGTVTGDARIDWDPQDVTSTGAFTSQSLDLAAAFGPVENARGTIVFTDLLGLTTAPDQLIEVGVINPGIEVYDGEVRFQLTNGERVAVSSARWPFLGGFLSMRPVTLNLGIEEYRTYEFDVEAMEAAKFVARMELNNFSATGTFDGTIPIIFDPQGNGRIEGGRLVSREPGGNVSYQGDLLYEDMPMMAEFAFQALKSLDYKRMRIALDGPLAGELVTRVRFDGVSQGPGAENNIVTRQLAKLPLRFDVNIRAPFQKIIGSVRSLYDPSAIRDPRSLGLIDADGRVVRDSVTDDEAPPERGPLDIQDEAVIQRPESEDVE